jgi:malate dehydrogenase (oxaloacetate-decarboxylating)(NADP+)
VDGRVLIPGQANNAYIFPGLGLGIVLSGASRVSEGMFHVAAYRRRFGRRVSFGA